MRLRFVTPLREPLATAPSVGGEPHHGAAHTQRVLDVTAYTLFVLVAGGRQSSGTPASSGVGRDVAPALVDMAGADPRELATELKEGSYPGAAAPEGVGTHARLA